MKPASFLPNIESSDSVFCRGRKSYLSTSTSTALQSSSAVTAVCCYLGTLFCYWQISYPVRSTPSVCNVTTTTYMYISTCICIYICIYLYLSKSSMHLFASKSLPVERTHHTFTSMLVARLSARLTAPASMFRTITYRLSCLGPPGSPSSARLAAMEGC